MSLVENLAHIRRTLRPNVKLCAVSKFHPASSIEELYNAGQRLFGESRPQELAAKYDSLPKDIVWHFIGHLQTNKVALIAPFVAVIESVDSLRLLDAISTQAVRLGRTIDILLEVHIAEESTKQGFSPDEIKLILGQNPPPCVRIVGLMGMATLTRDTDQIRRELLALKALFDLFPSLETLSMGMSGDYLVAMECGSTEVRIGSSIFGTRI